MNPLHPILLELSKLSAFICHFIRNCNAISQIYHNVQCALWQHGCGCEWMFFFFCCHCVWFHILTEYLTDWAMMMMMIIKCMQNESGMVLCDVFVRKFEHSVVWFLNFVCRNILFVRRAGFNSNNRIMQYERMFLSSSCTMLLFVLLLQSSILDPRSPILNFGKFRKPTLYTEYSYVYQTETEWF